LLAILLARVWNYAERKVELIKDLGDEPTSLSVHPTGHDQFPKSSYRSKSFSPTCVQVLFSSGIFIVVGFSEKIKIMTLLVDGVCETKEITVRMCSQVKFSQGGHFFLAAVGSHYIQIFNTFTGTLRAS
jgi:hypothetical protein